MTSEKESFISFDATTRCDRGCSHCSYESTPEGIDFTVEKTQKVVRLIEESGFPTVINITGGGEPLLNKDLPEIVNLISASPFVSRISLVTSGFRTPKERKNLKDALKNAKDGKLKVVLSFHLFSGEHKKRMTDTIRFLLKPKNRLVKDFSIKTTLALSAKERTLGVLNGIFNRFEVYSYLIDPKGLKRIKMFHFEKKIYSKKYYDHLFALAHFTDCWFWQEETDKGILVTAQPLASKGRAKKQPGISGHFKPHCPTMVKPEKIEIDIDVNGSIFPSAGCNSKAYPNLSIATLDDSWQKVMAIRDHFAQQMLSALLADKRPYDHPNNICSLCSKIKAEEDVLV
jgi:organic radical activating enzyme